MVPGQQRRIIQIETVPGIAPNMKLRKQLRGTQSKMVAERSQFTLEMVKSGIKTPMVKLTISHPGDSELIKPPSYKPLNKSSSLILRPLAIFTMVLTDGRRRPCSM